MTSPKRVHTGGCQADRVQDGGDEMNSNPSEVGMSDLKRVALVHSDPELLIQAARSLSSVGYQVATFHCPSQISMLRDCVLDPDTSPDVVVFVDPMPLGAYSLHALDLAPWFPMPALIRSDLFNTPEFIVHYPDGKVEAQMSHWLI